MSCQSEEVASGGVYSIKYYESGPSTSDATNACISSVREDIWGIAVEEDASISLVGASYSSKNGKRMLQYTPDCNMTHRSWMTAGPPAQFSICGTPHIDKLKGIVSRYKGYF